MTEKHKEIATKIILLLKNKGLVPRFEIANHVNIGQYKNDLSTVLETLKEDGLISETGNHIYKITTKGSMFESFEKLEEEMSLETRLAKSNLEANEFQKQMAIKNEIKEKSNRRLMRISIAVGIVSIISIVIQVVIAILQAE